MSWIKTIPYDEANPSLRRLYNKVSGPDKNVDNVLLIHSLRPHTLKGHMTLYKSVLHHTENTLPKYYLETIGIYVSQLNECSYCVQHHFEGLNRLVGSDKARHILQALQVQQPEIYFDTQYSAGLHYAKKITLDLHSLTQDDVKALQSAGFTDGQILEINQVSSYFNYVNRSVIGLGVNTDGDVLGLSPGDTDDPDNWQHQ